MSNKSPSTTYNLPPKSYISGFLWLAFSGTAMVSAFILPVHIWALLMGFRMNFSSLPLRAYFIVLFLCALYHALYRVKTILKDLGF